MKSRSADDRGLPHQALSWRNGKWRMQGSERASDGAPKSLIGSMQNFLTPEVFKQVRNALRSPIHSWFSELIPSHGIRELVRRSQTFPSLGQRR